MKRFRSILIVPITQGVEPPPGLFEAVELAEKSGARLAMATHLDDRSDALLGGGHHELLAALHERERESLVDRLSRWAQHAERPDIVVEVIDGSLPDGVARMVDAAGHDLVVIATDGTGVASTAARRIVDVCHCPVWLLRPGFRGANVLAAVDPSHSDEQNRLILALARSQAELHGGRLRVMHAWEFVARDPFGGTLPDGVDAERVARLVDQLESAHRDWMADLARAADLPSDTAIHLIDGQPIQAIEGLAVLYRIDLVVLGAGRTRADRLGLGSTTDWALADLRYSTLAVSPPT